jgi:hypothetical protein
VDVAAPGTSILSVAPGGSYNYYAGTSVSAAIVTGIVGLVHSYLPKKSIASVKSSILDNVKKCASLGNKVATKGRVDAYGALTSMPQAEDPYIGISDVKTTLGIHCDTRRMGELCQCSRSAISGIPRASISCNGGDGSLRRNLSDTTVIGISDIKATFRIYCDTPGVI